jgi:hypothetical protein
MALGSGEARARRDAELDGGQRDRGHGDGG